MTDENAPVREPVTGARLLRERPLELGGAVLLIGLLSFLIGSAMTAFTESAISPPPVVFLPERGAAT